MPLYLGSNTKQRIVLAGDYTVGYTKGREEGLAQGFEQGKTEGEALGYQNGFQEGKELGYDEGYEAGANSVEIGYINLRKSEEVAF